MSVAVEKLEGNMAKLTITVPAEAFQAEMAARYRKLAGKHECLLAPVGEKWWEEIHRNPSVDLYYEDRRHASVAGSTLAARVIFDALGIGYSQEDNL